MEIFQFYIINFSFFIRYTDKFSRKFFSVMKNLKKFINKIFSRYFFKNLSNILQKIENFLKNFRKSCRNFWRIFVGISLDKFRESKVGFCPFTNVFKNSVEQQNFSQATRIPRKCKIHLKTMQKICFKSDKGNCTTFYYFTNH